MFLDTQLYNAHTLAVDMLWAGVPLVTAPATSLASRVSGCPRIYLCACLACLVAVAARRRAHNCTRKLLLLLRH